MDYKLNFFSKLCVNINLPDHNNNNNVASLPSVKANDAVVT